MNAAVKLVLGIVLFLIGLYWYLPGTPAQAPALLGDTLHNLKVVFTGVFGLILVFLGLIIAWIEIEDMKWESKEKKQKAQAEQKPEKKAEKK